MNVSFLPGQRLTRLLPVPLLLLATGVEAQPAGTDSRRRIVTADGRSGDPRPMPILRAGVDLVLVPVTVTNRQGKTVTGLGRSAFSVFEEGARQQIASLSTEDVPCSVGVVLDVSGSMRSVASAARQSIHAFLRTLETDDEVSLVTVSDRPWLHVGLGADWGGVQDHLRFLPFAGSTAVVDSIQFALQQMRGATLGRRALLVVSDGRDNHSRFSKTELLQFAIEAGVQIYTLGITEMPRTKHEAAETLLGINLLEDLSEATGGLHSVVRDSRDVESTATQFGRAMHDQYLITYYSKRRSDDGKWRKIQVRVTHPDNQQVRIYSRRRYFVLSR